MVVLMSLKLRWLAALIVTLSAILVENSAMATETYSWYFVRHAEKTAEKVDPQLSEAGHQRAQLLAEMLAESGIKAIYATAYQRTQQTAAPLAQQLQLGVQTYAAGEPEQLLEQLQQAQQTSLIVGHSNTIPALVRLAGGQAEDLTEQQYGDLFILQLTDGTVISQRHQRVESQQ